MTNDISDASAEEAVPCFALSKNDSYVMSASGGKISLFNMMTFKVVNDTIIPPCLLLGFYLFLFIFPFIFFVYISRIHM